MIGFVVPKNLLQESLEQNKLASALNLCMTNAGMEKKAGPIYFEHMRIHEDGGDVIISSTEMRAAEEVLNDVINDEDNGACLWVRQEINFNA